MNRSIILVTLIALVVAVLVATVVSKTLGGKSGGDEAANIKTAQILVAAKRLKIGDEIEPDDLEWMDWPEDAMYAGVIKRQPKSKKRDDTKADKKGKKDDADEHGISVVKGDDGKKKKKNGDDEDFGEVEPGKDKLVGKMVRREIEKSEPVTMKSVVEESEGNFLAARLGEGMRAIGVSIKAESSAGGFIKPGDYVDVILTYQVRSSGPTGGPMSMIAQRLATQTVLSNVKVLAIDQNATADDDEKIKPGRTATLELNRKQAETLMLAEKMGDLSLALRRLGEDDQPGDAVSMDFTTDVLTVDVLRKQAELMSSGDTVTGNTVRVYSGPYVNDVPVKTAPQSMTNNSN